MIPITAMTLENHRHSRQRETILGILQNTKIHPTAEWVYERVRKQIPHISMGTVYRNLRLLTDLGYIREIHFGDSQTRYDSHLEEHQHFICSRCRSITDLDYSKRGFLYKRLEQKLKCRVLASRLDFFGLCRSCLRMTEPTKHRTAGRKAPAVPERISIDHTH